MNRALAVLIVVVAMVTAGTAAYFVTKRPGSLATDGAGHFDAILSMAPATLPGALITVVVQTAAAVPVARGSITIVDPNVFLPAHDAP